MRARQIVFASGELKLTGELVAPDHDARTVVVLCHGIPSGRPPEPGDLGYAGFARELAMRGFAAFWFDARGVRGAPGDFSLEGWCDDLRSALDLVKEEGMRVVVCGSSAGGAAAIWVARERNDVEAVAAFAAPAAWDFGDIASTPEGLIGYFRNIGIIRDPAFPADPGAWLAQFGRIRAEDAIAGISPRPVFLVQGDADGVVPPEHAERLFAAAQAPKELARIPGGAHQLRKDPRAIEALADWLNRH